MKITLQVNSHENFHPLPFKTKNEDEKTFRVSQHTSSSSTSKGQVVEVMKMIKIIESSKVI
jgi:hypothetical protein